MTEYVSYPCPLPHSTTISGNVPIASFFCRLPSLICVQDAWSLLIQVSVNPHAFSSLSVESAYLD